MECFSSCWEAGIPVHSTSTTACHHHQHPRASALPMFTLQPPFFPLMNSHTLLAPPPCTQAVPLLQFQDNRMAGVVNLDGGGTLVVAPHLVRLTRALVTRPGHTPGSHCMPWSHDMLWSHPRHTHAGSRTSMQGQRACGCDFGCDCESNGSPHPTHNLLPCCSIPPHAAHLTPRPSRPPLLLPIAP